MGKAVASRETRRRGGSFVTNPEHIVIAGDIPALIWRGVGANPRPVIISLHGGGGSKADVDPAVPVALIADGVTLVTVDAYKHGERAPTGFDMTRARANLATFLDIIEHTARDLVTVTNVLRDDPAVDEGRIGLRGGSMGGYIVLMAAGLGVPAAAVLSICGGADYARIWDLRGAGAGRPGAGAVLDRASGIDPIYHPNAFPPRPVLMIHGANDPIVPIVGQQALYAALAPLYAEHPGDCLFLTHAGEHATPRTIEQMGWAWLTRVLHSRPE